MKKIIIKSPLRYPGGKSRALKRILPLIPEYSEFREPMVGGGSVFFALKQKYPNKTYWINDIDTELYYFWKYCKENPNGLISEIKRLKRKYRNGKQLYTYLVSSKLHKESWTSLQRAARFFVLNRITFSGLTESGGYSEEAFKTRFTSSSLKRIRKASKLLKKVKITNTDYSELIRQTGRKVFIFLDPPYYSNSKSKLYGYRGELHIKFNHSKFFKEIATCKHKWLVTYDNCSKIQKLFNSESYRGWSKLNWCLQYGTNNSKDSEERKAKIGKELFILNYKLKLIKYNT